MRRIWPLAMLVSLGTHGAFLAGAQIIWGPKPLPAQKPPEARLEFAVQPIAASTADAAPMASEAAAAESASGHRVGRSAIPESKAQASGPASVAAALLPVAADAVTAAETLVDSVLPILPNAVQATADPAGGQPAQEAVLPTYQALAGRPASAAAAQGPLGADIVTGAKPLVTTALTSLPYSDAAAAPPMALASDAVREDDLSVPSALRIAPNPVRAGAARVSGQSATDIEIPQSVAPIGRPAFATATLLSLAADVAAAARPFGQTMQGILPDLRPAMAADPESELAPPLPPPSEHGTATLAWSGNRGTLDALSLAAVQAFMQPGDLAATNVNSGRLRDGVAATLSAVPCARLQTTFDPETGSLELRGHLPDEALRAPVIAALQAQVGSDLPVRDRLQLLPRPQCQVLGEIANAGLAQSTEQDTNPRVVGPDTFVRNYDLRAGQRLVFDMTAPDYPAFIYVDYFDKAGNVLHMQPNEQVPAMLSAPKSTLSVGQSAPGLPALHLVVGPPFGQEIAVALATSVPLYEGVRPTVEPAEPYLQALSAAIAEARSTTPDFKGEWVYFLVTTAP